MTAETDRSWQEAEAITGVERVKRALRAVFAWLRRPVRWLFEHSPFSYGFSSLSRRIVVLNLIGLAILVSGILYLNQFRAGLIDAKVQSLLTQGEIIAGALAASAGVDTDQVQLDPGSGARLVIDMQRYANQPTLAHPWDRARMVPN